MIGLLIITHQTLGAAYTQLAQHFFPNQNLHNIKILNVETTDDHAYIIEQAQQLIPQLNSGNGVLILTDIFGATPCNAALKLIVPQHSVMVTGLNAPMLIKAASYAQRYDNLTEFAQLTHDAGINGIMMFTEAN
ncbi:PTS sugar transporter subunit IIA [Neisseriaceae bacterium B1]